LPVGIMHLSLIYLALVAQLVAAFQLRKNIEAASFKRKSIT